MVGRRSTLLTGVGFALLLTFAAGLQPAAAATYYLWDTWGGTWADAEKSADNTEDDLLCWAASSSNVLEWTGWGKVGGMNTTDEIFAHYQDHWSDDLGNSYYGVEWWFDGTNNMQGEPVWAQEDVDGGGGFYSEALFLANSRWTGTHADIMTSLDAWLHDGYATTLSISAGTGSGHSITAWGFDWDPASTYTGVWVTDSDNDKSGDAPRPDSLNYYDISRSGDTWYLQDYFGSDDWYLREVFGLKASPDLAPVPEPASIFLLGSGLVGLAHWGRKRKR